MNSLSKTFFWGVVLVVGFFTNSLNAGGGPENLVLVVNAESDSSKLIANWYIHDRKIPARNVIYLSGIPNRERVPLEVFKEKILEPVIEEMTSRKLVNSVDYVAYSSDFPTGIDIKPLADKLLKVLEKENPKFPKQLIGARSSINSMTYFFGAVIQDNPGFMMLESNNYYRKPASVLLRRPFVGQKQIDFQKTIESFDSKDAEVVDKAIEDLLNLAKSNPQQLAVTYWLSKFYGAKGDDKNCLAWLRRSIQLGWSYRKQTEADLAFDSVKSNPDFVKIVGAIPSEPFDFVPTMGFKSLYSFGPNGMRNSEPGQGNRHLLSCVLAVTRNFGSTEKAALASLRKSVKADESKPKGKFYFSDIKGEVRCRTRSPNFAVATAALERLGQTTVVNRSPFPKDVNDILGATTGKAALKLGESNSNVVPGAICENLTSFGGNMAQNSHTRATELTDLGAAGSCGTVIEPYAVQAKFPHPMIHAHYARGCSLAEAFYQSVHGPFQLLVVGDPLCQPWATKPKLNVEGIVAGETASGNKQLKLTVSEAPVQGMELYLDGVMVRRAPFADSINFDTKTLTDGFHELRLVAIGSGVIQSVGHSVLPIVIDNFGKSTTVTIDRRTFELGENVEVKVSSNFGDKIELIHNHRSLGIKKGREVVFEVPAKELGRGPVKLMAVAISEKGNKVASVPEEIEIQGPLSVTRVDTETRKKK